MPKDHLLYVRLKALGLADLTFTPEYPASSLLALVSPQFPGWAFFSRTHFIILSPYASTDNGVTIVW
jgi:hypothetical protein